MRHACQHRGQTRTGGGEGQQARDPTCFLKIARRILCEIFFLRYILRNCWCQRLHQRNGRFLAPARAHHTAEPTSSVLL